MHGKCGKNKSLKIPDLSKTVIRRTDNTLTNKKRDKKTKKDLQITTQETKD